MGKVSYPCINVDLSRHQLLHHRLKDAQFVVLGDLLVFPESQELGVPLLLMVKHIFSRQRNVQQTRTRKAQAGKAAHHVLELVLGAGHVLADVLVGNDLGAALAQKEGGQLAGGGASTLPHGAQTWGEVRQT